MAMCRVFNKHPDGLTHREKFREQMIEIPAGGYVEMDYEDAVLFKGQFFPMKTNADGTPSREGFKCILLEPVGKPEPVAEKFISQIDGKEFATQAELSAHIKQFQDLVVKDEALELELASDKKSKSP